MKPVHETVAQYVAHPTEVELNWFDRKAASCFAGFFSGSCRTGIMKWLAVRSVSKALVKKGYMESFGVHLKWTWKPMAFMNDAGHIYLSVGLLAKSSAVNVLSVYCHELSHIRLSQHRDYSDIKTLQRQFKQCYADHKLCELMSPIEIYTMLISEKLLRQITADTPHGDLADDLEQKIRMLDDQIRQLPH